MLLVEPGCEAYLQPTLVSKAQENEWRRRGRPDIFFMEFHVSDVVLNWPEDGRPRRLRDMDSFGQVQKKSFKVRRVELLRNRDLGVRCILSFLSAMGVPSIFHSTFARVIHLRASTMAYQTANAGRSIIPIVVEILAGNVYEGNIDEEDDDEIVAEVARSSLEDEINSTAAPATKASIEMLEKVEMKDVKNFMDKCMICLEELWIKSEIIRMPCSHLYHGDCIVQWLETSRKCPLCRFEMPSALD